MRRGLRLEVLSVLLSVAAGCAHVVNLQPSGQRVLLVTETPQGCAELGEVFGKSNADDSERAMIGARNDIRNRAGLLKATHVVLETNNSRPVQGDFKQGVEILLGGRALRCPPK